MLSKILKLNISKYFFVSCMASVLDFCISYLLYRKMGLGYITACNSGIISGFIFQCALCTRYIFKTDNLLNSLLVYLATFIMGIFLADCTMWTGYGVMKLPFLFSKALSMMVPFFITYFIRRRFLGTKTNEVSNNENLL